MSFLFNLLLLNQEEGQWMSYMEFEASWMMQNHKDVVMDPVEARLHRGGYPIRLTLQQETLISTDLKFN